MTTGECNESSCNNEAGLKQFLELYNLSRGYLENENDLVNQRMTWMLTIHGFLYATYGIVIQQLLSGDKSANALVAIRCIRDTFSRNACADFNYAFVTAELFLFAITLIGAGISFSGLLAVSAASRSIESVANIFNSVYAPEIKGMSKGQDCHSVYRFCQQDASVCGRQLMIPDLIGGGDLRAARRGRNGFYWLPVILLAGWIASIVYHLLTYFFVT